MWQERIGDKMEDYIVRATAADAQIRAFCAITKNTVETARASHNLSPVASAALGRVLTGGAMMGSMLKSDTDLLTLQVLGDGSIGQITVTADAFGNVKGYVTNPNVMLPPNAVGKLDVAGAVGKGYLRVIKDMGLKEPYSGQIELQSGEIADDLTYYFATSEQVPSSVGLGVLMNKEDGSVKQAGGFIIQLMPFAEEDVIIKLEENLKKVISVTKMLEEGNTPEKMLETILSGLQPTITDTLPVRFHCNCEKKRVEKAIISIGKKEIKDMIEEGKPIEVNCHFCNKNYTFSVDELKELLRKAGKK